MKYRTNVKPEELSPEQLTVAEIRAMGIQTQGYSKAASLQYAYNETFAGENPIVIPRWRR